jgi:hypothetical protein
MRSASRVLLAVWLVGCGARTGLYAGFDEAPDGADATGLSEAAVEDRGDDGTAPVEASTADRASFADSSNDVAADAEDADASEAADGAEAGLLDVQDDVTLRDADAAPPFDATVDATDATLGDASDAAPDTFIADSAPGPEAEAEAEADAPEPVDSTVDDAPVDAGADSEDVAKIPDACRADCPPPPPSPRLVSPLSGCAVSTHTPTLRWVTPSTPVHVDVCADRACSTILWSQDVADSTQVQVGTSLPSGYVYWRASTRDPDSGQPTFTPTWQFAVLGTNSAPIMSSWNNFHDLEGDGFADLLVYGGPSDLPVQEYQGSAQGTVSTPIQLGTSTPTWAAAGDVTGDGIADVVAMVPDSDGGFELTTYIGSTSGPVPQGTGFTMPGVTLSNPQAGGAFIADVNGDGFGDWVSVDQAASAPSISVFFGSGTGLSAAASQTIALPAGTSTAAFAYYAGDLDADGYPDMAVSDTSRPGDAGEGSGVVYVYTGGLSGFPNSPVASIAPSGGGCSFLMSDSRFGYSVTFGDLNRDGYGDLQISNDQCSRLDVVGGPTGLPSRAFSAGCISEDPCPAPMAGALGLGGGDVNGDGYVDISIGVETVAQPASPDLLVNIGPDLDVGTSIPVPVPLDGTLVFAPVNLGDVNGDGISDFAEAWTSPESSTQGVSVFLGSTNPAATFPVTPVTTLFSLARPF